MEDIKNCANSLDQLFRQRHTYRDVECELRELVKPYQERIAELEGAIRAVRMVDTGEWMRNGQQGLEAKAKLLRMLDGLYLVLNKQVVNREGT